MDGNADLILKLGYNMTAHHPRGHTITPSLKYMSFAVYVEYTTHLLALMIVNILRLTQTV